MPSDPNDVLFWAKAFVQRLERLLDNKDDENSQELADEAWGTAKRLYLMLRHTPGIHNHGDAPERKN